MLVKRRLITLGICPLLLGSVFAQDNSNATRAEDDIGTLGSIARRAKAARQLDAIVSPPTMMLANPESLRDSLLHTTLVLAVPIASATAHDHALIYTWHKYRILETLSFQAPLATEDFSDTIPTSLLPIASDEFVMAEVGGTATVAGIRIVMQDSNVPALPAKTRHLMFVLFDSSHKVAVLNYGPNGSFYVDDSDAIHSRLAAPRGRLQSELFLRTAGKLRVLREISTKAQSLSDK
jgi:hypothetical protein